MDTPQRKPRNRKPDRSWEARFLQLMSIGAPVKHAAQAAGVTRQTAYKHREHFSDFAAAWLEAEDDGTDVLEQKAMEEAIGGNTTLLIFLLKARRPAKYRETLQVTTPAGEPLEITDTTRAEAAKELNAWREQLTADISQQIAGLSSTLK